MMGEEPTNPEIFQRHHVGGSRLWTIRNRVWAASLEVALIEALHSSTADGVPIERILTKGQNFPVIVRSGFGAKNAGGGVPMRTGQRGGGLLFQGDDRIQRHRDVNGRLDELANRALAQVEPAAEITHRRRQARADDVGGTLSGDRGALTVPHPGQMRALGLMLGDDRGQLEEFGDLVPGGAQRRWDRVRWAKTTSWWSGSKASLMPLPDWTVRFSASTGRVDDS